jgi:hypothetical protein
MITYLLANVNIYKQGNCMKNKEKNHIPPYFVERIWFYYGLGTYSRNSAQNGKIFVPSYSHSKLKTQSSKLRLVRVRE